MSAHGTIEGVLDWAIAARPLEGELVSGDLHCVAAGSGGALLGVIDGLGHGPEAAAAARAAAAVMAEAPGAGLASIVQRCHCALARLRGAVMSLAWFDFLHGSVTWTGVGNVEGVLLRAPGRGQRERLLVRGGIVGQAVPPQYVATLPIERGATLVLATDGVRPTFADRLSCGTDAAQMANEILQSAGSGRDDALVMVAIYRGPSS